MIEALSHITFVVSDLGRMSDFLTAIFDAKEIYSSGEEKFFVINGLWVAIIEGEPLAEKTYDHVAFKVAEADFEEYLKRVRSLGVEIREGRDRINGEAKSLYFYDYDNHLFEIHTGALEQRLETYDRNATN